MPTSLGKHGKKSLSEIQKFSGRNKTSIAKIDGISIEAGAAAVATGATVAVIGSSAGWLGYSSGAGDWTSGTWTFYDTGVDLAYEVEYGYKPDGTEMWLLNINKTANPLKYSTAAVPSQTSDWTDMDVIHGTQQSFGSAYGYSGSNAIATFVAVGTSARHSYTLSGDPTNTSNWVMSSRLNSDCGTTAEIRDVAFNGDINSPVFVAVNNQGFIASSTDGASWTTRRNINNSMKALYRVEYGNGVWVACGYYGSFEHMTGSADGTTWGVMNRPPAGLVRQMFGVATNGAGNWVVVGSGGIVWTSSDNAVTWVEQQVPDSRGAGNYTQMLDVAYDGDGSWVVVGQQSEIWKSTNNGSSWTNVTPSRGTYANFQSIQFNKTKA